MTTPADPTLDHINLAQEALHAEFFDKAGVHALIAIAEQLTFLTMAVSGVRQAVLEQQAPPTP